jgi:hypothetical protein
MSPMNESLLLNKKIKTNLIKPHINRQSLLANPNMKLKFKNFRKVKKSFSEGNSNN